MVSGQSGQVQLNQSEAPSGPMACGVIGSPIAHSLSPALHRAAYAALGLDWTYDAHEVTEEGLSGFLTGLGEQVRGLSVTAPLKVGLMQHGTPDADAVAVGVANTWVRAADGSTTVHNTDVAGLVGAIRAAHLTVDDYAVIIGSGATARSAVVALQRIGCPRVGVMARSEEKAAGVVEFATGLGLQARVAPFLLPSANDLIISTVPLEAVADRALGLVSSTKAVFDVVYDPWPSPLADQAHRDGKPALSGLDLLAHQAVGQIELMTGRKVDVEVLLSAGRQELNRRAEA